MRMIRAFFFILFAYLLAGAVAWLALLWLPALPPMVAVGLADFIATCVVFLFSLWARNSSVYDPYWSVAPVPIALFWLGQSHSAGLASVRHLLIFVLLCLWALRLTLNWGVQWRGLNHEDWRYRDIQKQSGAWYWPVSFLGIHLMPTILVFLGCLALWPALSDNGVGLTWLDALATLVTLAAVALEGLADFQMRAFRRRSRISKETRPAGLWSLSRHPNYFGEVLFWWGLYLFVPLLFPGFWWVIIGPLCITALFLGISIPLMERHLLSQHPIYAAYQQEVSRFFPWFPR